MSWCPNCGAEYRPGFTVCADCNVALSDEPPPEDLPEQIAERASQKFATEHPNNEVRTVYLGRFGRFEAEIVLDILNEAGIFAFNKQHITENDHYAYAPLVEGEAGRILVDASRVDEARALVEAQLPEHLRSIQESMRSLHDAPGDVDNTPDEDAPPWGGDWQQP